jgi:hypothetical protein
MTASNAANVSTGGWRPRRIYASTTRASRSVRFTKRASCGSRGKTSMAMKHLAQAISDLLLKRLENKKGVRCRTPLENL